jgi:hypothetical protein
MGMSDVGPGSNAGPFSYLAGPSLFKIDSPNAEIIAPILARMVV